MKVAIGRLSKLKLKTIRVSYSPTYTNFILNHIATNPAHPLYISQRRRQQEHIKEGLWWHATNGTDISKSGCVRTWARRRLRQAFVEELKAMGYDETGKLVDANAMQDRWDVTNVLRLGRSVDLAGSLRMHGVGPLIPAKYELVKEEVRGVIQVLVQSSIDTALGFDGEREKSSGLGQRTTCASAKPRSRKVQEKKTAVASAISTPAQKLPESTMVEAAKALLQTKPKVSTRPSACGKHTLDGSKRTATPTLQRRMEPQAEVHIVAPRTRRPHTKARAA